MKVALVGATGLVGQIMLKVLQERKFPVSELLMVASERSVGKTLTWNEKTYPIISLEAAVAEKPQLALFSAGGSCSLEWAPRFAAVGCRVVDNSSAWRMEADKKLIIPEVNGDMLGADDYIIANPNCSTIQLLMVLAPLHRRYGLKRVVISTYQSVSGTGMAALEQLANERAGQKGKMAYPYPIDKNCLPHCDVFLDNGYTKEEMKLVNETRKILGQADIPVTATAVRVPVEGGHSESVNVEFSQAYVMGDLRKLLADSPGVQLQDNIDFNQYPMPLYAAGKDEVFVGRLRRDLSQSNSLNLWIVADNLRKGAATNTVQIAEILASKGWL